jgi:hypothetical protein
MNLRIRDLWQSLGVFLIAFSAISLVFALSGAMRTAPPTLFMILCIGLSGVPAAVGVGIVVNHRQWSVRLKRKIIALTIVLIALAVFGGMFWMIGEAAYNQTNP